MVFGQVTWGFKIARILMGLASAIMRNPDISRLAAQLPEERQGELHIYDDSGNEATVCIRVGGGGVNVGMGGCGRPNNRVSMHINTLLDLVEGRVDFRTAVAHGAIVIESLDGRPWFYHYTLWAMVYDRLAEMMK